MIINAWLVKIMKKCSVKEAVRYDVNVVLVLYDGLVFSILVQYL